VFVLQESAETEVIGRDMKALFPTDPVFVGKSYNQRYQEMLRRFIGDNIYQAGWFLTTQIESDRTFSYAQPLATATGKSFQVAIQGRVDFVRSVLDV
jgi:hypothetical protein